MRDQLVSDSETPAASHMDFTCLLMTASGILFSRVMCIGILPRHQAINYEALKTCDDILCRLFVCLSLCGSFDKFRVDSVLIRSYIISSYYYCLLFGGKTSMFLPF